MKIRKALPEDAKQIAEVHYTILSIVPYLWNLDSSTQG